MEDNLKKFLLDTLATVKHNEEVKQNGIYFTSVYEEEPDWEMVIGFRPSRYSSSTPPDELH